MRAVEKRGEYAAVDGCPRLHRVTSYKEHLQNREKEQVRAKENRKRPIVTWQLMQLSIGFSYFFPHPRFLCSAAFPSNLRGTGRVWLKMISRTEN